MKKSYDAIVVGAGLAGLCLSRELARKKQRVLVLEQDRRGGNSSRAAAGILDPYSETEAETPQLRLAVKAYEFYPAFLNGLGPEAQEKIEFEKQGILYLALNDKDEAFLKKRCDWQKKMRLKAEFLKGPETHRLEPVLPWRVQAGVYYPGIPKVNADKLTSLVMQTARASGIEIETSVKDASLWQEKGRARGVKVGTSRIESPVVVAARGCWSSSDRKFGLKVDVRPVRGQILLVRPAPGRAPHHVLHTLRYAYAIPWPEGRVLVGSTLERAGYDCEVTPEGREDILDRASEIFADIRKFKIESSWAGLRPYAKRGRPFIGPARIKGFYLATGYYRAGVLLSPYAGRLLAEGILTGKFSPLIRPFFP